MQLKTEVLDVIATPAQAYQLYIGQLTEYRVTLPALVLVTINSHLSLIVNHEQIDNTFKTAAKLISAMQPLGYRAANILYNLLDKLVEQGNATGRPIMVSNCMRYQFLIEAYISLMAKQVMPLD